MRYQLTPIFCRPWTLNGLSLQLIESHYENNYGGAVRRLNAISEQLESLDLATTPAHVLNGLKREELVALNDVRPRAGVSRGQDIADGIAWRDPEQVQQWMGGLSKSEPVVVYCSYGFHVGCKTAIKLRQAGFDARYMNSGHSGWRAVGAPVKVFP